MPQGGTSMTFPFPYKTADGETLKNNTTIIQSGGQTDTFENITVLNTATIGNRINVQNIVQTNNLTASSISSGSISAGPITASNVSVGTDSLKLYLSQTNNDFSILGTQQNGADLASRIVVHAKNHPGDPHEIHFVAGNGTAPFTFFGGPVVAPGGVQATAPSILGATTTNSLSTGVVTATNVQVGTGSLKLSLSQTNTDFTILGTQQNGADASSRIVVHAKNHPTDPHEMHFVAGDGLAPFSFFGGPIIAPGGIQVGNLSATSMTLTGAGTSLTVLNNADIQGTLGAGNTSLSQLSVANAVTMPQKLRSALVGPPYLLLNNFNDTGQDWIFIDFTFGSTQPPFNAPPGVSVTIYSNDQSKMYTCQVFLITEQGFYMRIFFKDLVGTGGGLVEANTGPSISWIACAQ